ncbi:MAG: OmpA family protein [Deltaproteobacteria bacterium]|nr:OmpA family protein [Deltaproteobacteria bacterium]
MKKISFGLILVFILYLTGSIGSAAEQPTARDWFQKGVAVEAQGAYGEAVKMYTAAIERDPNFAEAYFKRAKALRASDLTSPTGAMADLTTTIALEPTNAEAYYERGLLNAFLINNENAIKDMKTAAALGHQGARKWLASGKAGTAAISQPEAAPQQAAVEEAASVTAGKAVTLREFLPAGAEPVVHFDFNMATLGEADAALLDDIAKALQEGLPEAKITIVGHTDEIGTESYNEELSLQRARAVESYLVKERRIAPERIAVKGYGKKDPLASNKTEEGRAQNRRAEILLGTRE